MQGNLREINIKNFIKFLAIEQKTGVLSVETPIDNNPNQSSPVVTYSAPKIKNRASFSSSNTQVSSIYFLGGKIAHTLVTGQYNLSRLKDYLTYYQLELNLDKYFSTYQVSDNTGMKEYKCLIWLVQKQLIQPLQVKSILLNLIEETIFDILLCKQGTLSFQVKYCQYPLYESRSTIRTIYKLERKLRQWKQFHPYILSPHQLLKLQDRADLKSQVSSRTYKFITSCADNKRSLLQLSRQLNCSLIDIGKALHPYLQKGLLTLETQNQTSLTQDLAT